MNSTLQISLGGIFDIVRDVTGKTREDLCGRVQKSEFVNARREFIRMALLQGHSFSTIGRALKRDHSTIMHHATFMGETINVPVSVS